MVNLFPELAPVVHPAYAAQRLRRRLPTVRATTSPHASSDGVYVDLDLPRI